MEVPPQGRHGPSSIHLDERTPPRSSVKRGTFRGNRFENLTGPARRGRNEARTFRAERQFSRDRQANLVSPQPPAKRRSGMAALRYLLSEREFSGTTGAPGRTPRGYPRSRDGPRL
jgi:hypothetical protein